MKNMFKLKEQFIQMQQTELTELFKKYKALLSGHFQLSSGLHSNGYFQSALILQYPAQAKKIAMQISHKIKEYKIKVDVIVSPAIGGIVIGHEVGEVLGVRSIFTERVNNFVKLRRNFSLCKNEKVLIVEDVITTGLSTNEVIQHISSTGAIIVAVASIVDRRIDNTLNLNVPIISLLKLQVNNYPKNKCPMCCNNQKIVKPGSRELI
ncbi:MAG: orotate phosphoribosyltransferase [Endomicrobium sp.]|jgi:orotate phosphoribosyltransferase|nr:orotate phosphoribosyltransferase [Endomicrobium sp.]